MNHDQHNHAHVPNDFGRAFAIGIVLNVGFVLIEVFYGWRADSLALLADAAHNLSDVGGLLLAWAAKAATRLRPEDRHTYGWRRGSVLASFANALILLVAMGSLAWEAVQRLQAPILMNGMTIMVVAGIGVLVNGITAALFVAGSKQDLNIRGAFLHMAADTLVSLGVVLAGGLYMWQGWQWIDLVVSLVIAAVITIGTWSLFCQSLHLLFDGVPAHVDLVAVRKHFSALPGVLLVHDLHVWSMDTAEAVLSAHLVTSDETPDGDALLRNATHVLHEQFSIHHVTLQIESQRYSEQCGVHGC